MMFQNTCKLVLECELDFLMENLHYVDDDINSIRRLLELYDSIVEVQSEIEYIHEQIGIIYALRKLQLIDTSTWVALHNKYVEAIAICEVKLVELS